PAGGEGVEIGVGGGVAGLAGAAEGGGGGGVEHERGGGGALGGGMQVLGRRRLGRQDGVGALRGQGRGQARGQYAGGGGGAVWMTAVSGCSAGIRASRARTASRSVVSQAAMVTWAPRPVSSLRRASAPGAAGPRRLARTRCLAPRRATRCRAVMPARVPVPP